MKKLLDAGANPNAKDVTQASPLKFAASDGYVEIGSMLIAAGADKNSQDIYSRTALHEAVGRGRSEFVSMLVKAGANVYAKDAEGQTPLMLARQAENSEAKPQMMGVLIGAEVGHRTFFEFSAAVAAKRGKEIPQLLEELLDEIGPLDEDRKTAILSHEDPKKLASTDRILQDIAKHHGVDAQEVKECFDNPLAKSVGINVFNTMKEQAEAMAAHKEKLSPVLKEIAALRPASTLRASDTWQRYAVEQNRRAQGAGAAGHGM